MNVRSFFVLGAVMTASSSAYAIPSRPPFMTPKKASAEQSNYTYRQRLEALRSKVIATQARDGGVFTDAHRAVLQDRLHRIHTDFRR